MAGYNSIVGTNDNDRLIGTPGPDDIDGLDGNDIIKGGGGDDILVGGRGDDRVLGGAGGDLFNVWIGNRDIDARDRYFGGSGQDDLFADVFATRDHIGVLLFDTVRGIFGFSKAATQSTISGIEGFTAFTDYRVRAIGGAEDNTFLGGTNRDVLNGGGGTDHLSGNEGRDKIFGGNGGDHLMGGTGGDKLFGGKGADTLAGDTGGDRLYGGKDNARDVFVYSDASDSPSDSSQTDKVFDFVSGVDVFDFRWMDADTSTDAHDDFGFSAAGPAAHRVWTQSVDGGSLVMADNTGDALADLVVFVSDVSHLDVGDFWLSTPGG